MITFDSSWADLFSQLSLLPNLKHCVPFFSTCLVSTCCVVKTSPAVGTALLCSRVLGSRSLAVSLSSRPFGTCFNQPTMHPLGLKASVVHDYCKRRCCGHRISNLLNTLDNKGSQYPPFRRALCFRKHKRHLVTRIVNIHTLAFMCAGVPTFSNLMKTVCYSHSLNSFAPARSGVGIPTAVSTSSVNLLQNRGNHG